MNKKNLQEDLKTKPSGETNVTDKTADDVAKLLTGDEKTSKMEQPGNKNNTGKTTPPTSKNGKNKQSQKPSKPGKGNGKKENNSSSGRHSNRGGRTDTDADKKLGAKTTSENFKRNESSINGETNATANSSDPSLNVKGFRLYSLADNGYVSYELFNNSKLDVKFLNAESVDLGKSRDIKRQSDKLKALRVERRVVLPRTAGPSYRTEIFDEDNPVNDTFFKSIVRDTDRNLNIAYSPMVATIVMSLNVSRYNNKILKIFLENIKLELSTFTGDFVDTKGLMWYAKTNKEDGKLDYQPDPKDSFFKTRRLGETKRGYIASFIPKFKGMEKTFQGLELKVFYDKLNLIQSGNLSIDDSFEMDVGTWSTNVSNNNFLSNLENAVQNDPKWTIFAGLVRNNPTLLHLHHSLVIFNTVLMLIFSSLTHSANSAGFIMKKIGYMDTTFKHLATSVIAKPVQAALKEWAAWMSMMPYNKKVVDMFEKYGHWGMLGNDDNYSEHNILAIPAFVLIGDLIKNTGLTNFLAFRDNAAATSVVINTDSPLSYFIENIVKFFDYKPAEYTNANYSISNQPMYLDALYNNNDWVWQIESMTICKHRITDWVYNAVMTMTRDVSFIDSFNKYFRRISQFLEIYKIPGVLDGTDWEVKQVEVPIFTNADIVEPEKFQHVDWFRGMHFGQEFNKVNMYTEDKLQLGSDMPTFPLYPGIGDSKVSYDNFIGFLWTSSVPKNINPQSVYYSKSDFLYPWFKIDTQVHSVNVLDATIFPFIPYEYSIKMGWNYGTLARGETYQFTVGKDHYLQFYPMMFEWSKPYSPAMWDTNKESSVPVLTNNDFVGYYVSQSLVPGLSMTKNRSGMVYALYNNKDWNLLPYNIIKHKGEKFNSLIVNPNKPFWKVEVAQLFRNLKFRGMSPLAFGVSYQDIPSLEECVIDEEE